MGLAESSAAAAYLSDSQRREIEQFINQLVDAAMQLKADRVRIEAEPGAINLVFLQKRETIRTHQVKSSGFDAVWLWLVYDAYVAMREESSSSPVFLALIAYKDAHLKFVVEKTKTLKKTKAIVLADFSQLAADQANKLKSDLSVQTKYRTKELDQWRRFAVGDSQTIAVNRS